MSQERLTLTETMKKIESIINENPDPIKELNTTFQFQITDIDSATYQLTLENGTAKIEEVSPDTEAACTLILSEKNFNKFLAGKLNGAMAFMSGKLKINGDMTKALKLESLLKQYTFPKRS